MKKLFLLISILSFTCLLFAQTKVNVDEINGSKIDKPINVVRQNVYKIDISSFINVTKSIDNSIKLELSFDKNYNLVLFENKALENVPAYYTDGQGVLHKDNIHIKLYHGFLKGDSTHIIRLSIIDNKYIDGFIKVGDDYLYLSSPEKNDGLTSVSYGKDIILADSSHSYCGTPDKNIVPLTKSTTTQYDFANTLRIMNIATDADYEYYQQYGTNTNARMLSIINQAEGLYTSTFNIAFNVVYTHYYTNTNNCPYTASPSEQNGLSTINQMQSYWNGNHSSINRNVAILFTAKNSDNINGCAYMIGGMTNMSTSYLFVTTKNPNPYLTLIHEIGHLCNGTHDDCQNNNTQNASVMCQGTKKDPPYFSSTSITRIGNHIGYYNYLQAISFSSGPDVMAINADVTYTISTSLPGILSWSASKMNLLSNSGNSAVFRTIQNGGAYVKISSSGGAYIQKIVHIGTPVLEIEGSHNIPNGQYATFRAIYPALANPTAFQWILNPINGNTLYGANSSVLDIAFHNTGNYQLVARATNNYGVGEYTTFGLLVYSANGTYMIYPNPADQELNITIVSSNNEQNMSKSSISMSKTYDIRLYNIQGTLVKTSRSNGETVSLNVGNMPNGIYFLHIYNDIEKNPSIQKIVIKH